MRKSPGPFNNFAANRRGNASRKANPLNIFGGTAVALAVLGSAWAVYTNVLGASIYPVVTASGVEPAVSPPLQLSARRKDAAFALLAAAYPPELTFQERLSGLDRPSVASVARGEI